MAEEVNAKFEEFEEDDAPMHLYEDKFVIAEATRDHAGNEKKLNFNYDNFKKF